MTYRRLAYICSFFKYDTHTVLFISILYRIWDIPYPSSEEHDSPTVAALQIRNQIARAFPLSCKKGQRGWSDYLKPTHKAERPEAPLLNSPPLTGVLRPKKNRTCSVPRLKLPGAGTAGESRWLTDVLNIIRLRKKPMNSQARRTSEGHAVEAEALIYLNLNSNLEGDCGEPFSQPMHVLVHDIVVHPALGSHKRTTMGRMEG